MDVAFALLFILLLLACWLLNLLNLPGNWINFLLILLWCWVHQLDFGWSFVLLIFCIPLLAEGIEFGSQLWGGKRYGGSRRGSLGSILGTLLGALFGAPFLFGLGAIFGALAGAFLGSLILEFMSGKNWQQSLLASKGALLGRAVGFVAKSGLGLLLIIVSLPRIWP